MRRAPVVFSLIVLIAVGASAHLSVDAARAGGSEAKTCVPRAAHVLRRVADVSVYRVGAAWFACRGRTGVRTRIAGGYEVLSGPRAIAVRGGLVAFGYQLYDDGIDGDIAYSYVGAVRLGHSVPALRAPPGYPSTVGPNGELNTPEKPWNVEDHIGAVVVTRSGWVGWISCRGNADHYDRCSTGQRALYVARPSSQTPQRLIARSSRIRVASLTVGVDAGTIHWVEDGRRRSFHPDI